MIIEVPEFELDATAWILPSTKGSKYAHAPNWSVFGYMPQARTACYGGLPSWDHTNLPEAHTAAEGKPPCPRCVRALKHHLSWLSSWVESYENLDWEDS